MGFFIALVGAAAGAFFGALAQRMFSQRQLQREATADLFKQFHSPEMMVARRLSWVYLDGPFRAKPHAIQDIHSGEDAQISEVYHAITQIIYFWFLLNVSAKQNEINKTLAREMFAYHYGQWHDAIVPLAEASHEREDPPPDWTSMFIERDLEWLSRS